MAFDLRQRVFRIPSDITVSVGIRWDFVGADPVDLDLSAVSFTKEGKLLDCVFFNHPFPIGTEEAALGHASPVDPQNLPYMFLSDDSRTGGEEEHQLSGLALATKRREYQFSGENVKRMCMVENVFSRLYDEKELDGVEEALGELYGGECFDEEGQTIQNGQKRTFSDELVTFVMHKIPSDVDVIFISVTSYTGADFTTLPSARCLVINETTNERVGMFDIKRPTGNGTANLVCMMCRLPSVSSERQLWDLRVLNIRTFGYTFVDVLPAMMDVLGVDPFSRGDAVRLLPDYPLTKENARYYEAHPLSHVRFGVGWGGEHDLDAFMVMFDAQYRYVDHLHSKEATRLSTHSHAARHSGDAINGFSTTGDDEFIDLITYYLPPNVSTIVFGVHYVESFGLTARKTRDIFDVPQLYARLQNRAMDRPKPFEVDRWDVHYGKTQSKHSAQLFSSKGQDDRTRGVRTLVLGAMVRQGEAPLSSLVNRAHLDQQHFRHEGTPENNVSTGAEEKVPLFGYYALHEHIPAGAADRFAAVVPFLHCVAQNRAGVAAHAQPQPNASSKGKKNTNLQDPVVFPSAKPTLWTQMKASGTIMDYYAVQMQFLEVRSLKPFLPRRFRCHGEAWVCDGANTSNKPLGLNSVPTYRTPFLIHQEETHWSERNSAAKALFFVRKFDRIRVVIYEYATLGFAELDLMELHRLWAPEAFPVPPHMGDGFNLIEMWVPLSGGEMFDGEVRLRMWRVPTEKVIKAREKEVKGIQKKREKYQKKIMAQRERANRMAYSLSCTLM